MKQTMESKIAEYQAAQDCYLHYDSFRWQAGSLLIAGVFVFWGLLISSTPPASSRIVGFSGVLVALLMSIWILFAHHYRQIYLCKLHRIYELEEDLLMEQHRRFLRRENLAQRYRISGPKGHKLDLAIYVSTSLGGSFLGYLRVGFDPWLLLPIPIVLVVLAWVQVNERRIFRSLDSNNKREPTEDRST